MVAINRHVTETLTAREERLLCKLHDGECGVLARWRAERLVERNPAAREFVAALALSKEVVVERGACVERCDLWSDIATRIAQEERAELFLGKRRETPVERFLSFLREHRQVAWGIPSGAVLAGLILFFVAPNPGSDSVKKFGVAKTNTGRAPVVNLASTDKARARQPVEVDWVRGNGRVRVMQDPSRNSAIIWVRRPQSPRFLPGERVVAPPPLSGLSREATSGGYPR